MRQFYSSLLVFFVSCVAAMSQGNPKSNVPAREQTQEKKPAVVEAPKSYVIGPEDVLSIAVWREPDLTTQVTVRPDGRISYPLLNDIHASGLTPMQLQEQITDGLKKFVNGPQVSVIVTGIASQVVYIHGAVAKPGVYSLGGPMRVMELIARAGGLGEFAKAEEIQILRVDNGKPVQFRFNFKRFLEAKDYEQNIILQRGDMVMVP